MLLLHCGGGGSRRSVFMALYSTLVSKSACIETGAHVGEFCKIGHAVFIGKDVKVGKDCEIAPGVVLQNAVIGNRVVIHPNASIGQINIKDGFGFTPLENGEVKKKEQNLQVIIEDDVEIGANCTIDRGSWRNTVIGKGTKMDNQVHVAHNVVIGKSCLIAAQCGIAGSVTIGNNVMIGGQTGIAQHLKIGDKVMIAGKSGVMNNLESNGKYGGVPALPIRDWHKQTILLKHLGKTTDKIKL